MRLCALNRRGGKKEMEKNRPGKDREKQILVNTYMIPCVSKTRVSSERERERERKKKGKRKRKRRVFVCIYVVYTSVYTQERQENTARPS